MGMKSTIQAAVVSAFNALGDLVNTLTWSQPPKKKTRDQVTGAITSTATTDTVRLAFIEYKDSEVFERKIISTWSGMGCLFQNQP